MVLPTGPQQHPVRALGSVSPEMCPHPHQHLHRDQHHSPGQTEGRMTRSLDRASCCIRARREGARAKDRRQGTAGQETALILGFRENKEGAPLRTPGNQAVSSPALAASLWAQGPRLCTPAQGVCRGGRAHTELPA